MSAVRRVLSPANSDSFVSPSKVSLDNPSYEKLRQLLYEGSGIDLGEKKHSLVEARLAKRLSQHGCQNYKRYCELIQQNEEEFKQFIFALTTNKTDWFREPIHFEFLKNDLTQKPRKKPIMLWSAASSSGEESYSIGMTLEELGYGNGGYRILGTDINEKMVTACAAARYKEEVVKKQVNPFLLQRWFDRGISQGQPVYTVKSEIRQWCKFRPFNLQSSVLITQPRFDYIFLRNVLIYFDQPTIEHVVKRVSTYIKPGGYLFVGLSESLNGINHDLESIGNSIFKKS